MLRRFMLRLIIYPESDRGYIDFGPMNECPGDDVAYRRFVAHPDDGVDNSPVVSVDYDHSHKIVGIEILNPSHLLGHRFRTDGDQAVFPVDINVDYVRDEACITLRERRLDITFDQLHMRAAIDIRELSGRTVRSANGGPVAVHYNSEGKISAISMKGVSLMLPRRFLRSGSKGR